MSGVDHSDQMIAYAPLHRKTISGGRSLLYISSRSSWCKLTAFTTNKRNHVDLVDLAISVCTSIAEFNTQSETGAARDANLTADRLTGRHFLEEIVNAGGQKVRRATAVSAMLGKQNQILLYKSEKTKGFKCLHSVRPAKYLCVLFLAWKSFIPRKYMISEIICCMFFFFFFCNY